MKDINELTEAEAKELLAFVYPDDADNFQELRISEKINEDGTRNVTMGLRPITGVLFRTGINWDGAVLHFDNTKAVLWLYRHGYDIEKYLEMNSHYSEMENDFSHFAYEVESLSKPIEEYREGYKHNYNIDSIRDRAKKAVDEYYFNKEYK